MKIVDYIIVHEWNPKGLQYIVQDEIKNGWQPYGDMVVRKDDFYQVLVRYEEE